MIPVLDQRSVAVGAAVSAVIVVPASLIGDSLGADDGDGSAWVFVFLGLVVVGFALGGYVAATANPNMPYLHGVAAAVAAFAAVQLIGLCRKVLAGDDVLWFAMCFRALVAMTFGMVGGIVADSVRRRTNSGGG
ncbi:MAG: hypothetical protein S0880_09160 [Actinomycetota bacterium]|nr:hypothetical protein [Actinomycetota bacterium]